MRKLAGIGFIVQAVVFLVALTACFNPAVHEMFGFVKISTFGIFVFGIGVLSSAASAAYLFSNADIRNDGKLVLVIAQAFLPTLLLIQGSYWLLVIVALVFFLAFKFWRELPPA